MRVSKVRVHTDARGAESARAANALAYTLGQDIWLRIGSPVRAPPACIFEAVRDSSFVLFRAACGSSAETRRVSPWSSAGVVPDRQGKAAELKNRSALPFSSGPPQRIPER
ncbi:MAG: DUF4157 domain-containing protein [Terriglobia bacterium]